MTTFIISFLLHCRYVYYQPLFQFQSPTQDSYPLIIGWAHDFLWPAISEQQNFENAIKFSDAVELCGFVL